MQRSLPVPAARTAHLVTTQSKDEFLVYDQQRHHIHHLNPTAAAIWWFCDGTRTVSDLARAAAVDEESVRIALRKLDDAHLLDGPLSTEIRGVTQSRRTFMRKAAVAGAVAVPVVVSMSAPPAAAAQSGTTASTTHPPTSSTTTTTAAPTTTTTTTAWTRARSCIRCTTDSNCDLVSICVDGCCKPLITGSVS